MFGKKELQHSTGAVVAPKNEHEGKGHKKTNSEHKKESRWNILGKKKDKSKDKDTPHKEEPHNYPISSPVPHEEPESNNTNSNAQNATAENHSAPNEHQSQFSHPQQQQQLKHSQQHQQFQQPQQPQHSQGQNPVGPMSSIHYTQQPAQLIPQRNFYSGNNPSAAPGGGGGQQSGPQGGQQAGTPYPPMGMQGPGPQMIPPQGGGGYPHYPFAMPQGYSAPPYGMRPMQAPYGGYPQGHVMPPVYGGGMPSPMQMGQMGQMPPQMGQYPQGGGQQPQQQQQHGVGNITDQMQALDVKGKYTASSDYDKKSNHDIEEDWLIDSHECEYSKEIARGSFGVVYQGTFRGTDVAIKKLLVQQLNDQQMEEFLGEIKMMKKLHHPNVVLLIGICLDPANRAIVTELLAGSMWNLLHDKSVVVDAKLQLKLVLDTAKGMNYLHLFKPPVLHRDLKSPNLLVDKHFNVKIADFGLARIKASLMTSNLGTCQYMAPEVIQSQTYTEKADVFSFAIVIWEVLTRQLPYQGMQPMQIAYGLVHQSLRPPIPVGAPQGLVQIMTACWHQDPLQRPTFADILTSLKALSY